MSTPPALRRAHSAPRFWWLLIVTLLLAAGLRLWQIGALPPGLHYDEAADTIIAEQIARGDSAPLFIEAYTGKEVLFFYWAAAWMKLIGPSVYAMRLAAALLGVLTVAVTYRAVAEMFAARTVPSASPRHATGSQMVALLAAIFMATSFWHILMSRLGFRSISEPLLQALALAALFRGLRSNRYRWFAIAGALVGLNLYTYLAARLFPLAIAALFGFWLLLDRGRRLDRLTQFVVTVAAALTVFLPLGVYFAQHPAAFLTRIQQVAPRADQLTPLLENALRAVGMFFISGDPYIRFNLPGRPLFPIIWGLLLAIGLGVAAAGVIRGRTLQRRGAYFGVIVTTLIMLLPTALAVNEITPSNLRAIGLMPTVFVWPALGAWWVIKKFRTQPRLVLGLILVVAAVEAGFTYFGQYVTEPQLYVQSDGDLADIARWLNANAAPDERVYLAALHYRHPTVAALADDYARVKWISGDQTLVLPDTPATLIFARLALPDAAWLARFLPDSALVAAPLAPDSAPNGAPNGVTNGVPNSMPFGAPSYRLYRLTAQPVIAPTRSLRVNFGNMIELLGYDVEPSAEPVAQVTAYWRVLNVPDRGDYSFFAQLRDAWGFEWGNSGSFAYPSEQWTPGEILVQRWAVPVAAGAPPGEYELRVGIFSQGANARLNIVAADGGFGGTVATLSPLKMPRAAHTDAAALSMATRLDREVRPGLTLLGVSVETERVKQGAPIYFTLNWHNSAPVPDMDLTFQLASCDCSGADAVTRTIAITSPVHGAYPFSAWSPPESVADRYALRVPPDLPAGEYTLNVRVGDSAAIALKNLSVEKIDRVVAEPPSAYPLGISVSPEIELTGYDRVSTATTIDVTLVWQARQPLARDWTVFAHVLNGAGQVLGGRDNQPVNGTYPTSWWQAGEYIIDRYSIPIAPAPDQVIEVGWYDPETGERLGRTIQLK